MGNHARNLIDAIQNTMLDRLFLRLSSLWWLAMLWQGRAGATDYRLSLSLLAAVGLVFGLAWLIGVIANARAPRRLTGLADEPTSPSNGFEAWSEGPADSLRPPRFMRGVVTVLGLGRARWLDLAVMALALASIALLFSLTESAPASWADVSPAVALAETWGPDLVWTVLTVSTVAFVIRGWAVEQRRRLETPKPVNAGPDWYDYLVLLIMVAFFGVFTTVFFKLPLWVPTGLACAVLVLGLVPAWRIAALDIVFGKRTDA